MPSGVIAGKIGSWLTPVERDGVKGVLLAASYDTMCVLDALSSVRCMGMLASAERTVTAMQKFVPVAFPEKIVSIVGGSAHLCALADSGRAWCWGVNDHGQLGIGTLTNTLSPTASVG